MVPAYGTNLVAVQESSASKRSEPHTPSEGDFYEPLSKRALSINQDLEDDENISFASTLGFEWEARDHTKNEGDNKDMEDKEENYDY